MHIHVIGICGTLMAGMASLAKDLGHTVTGCDQNVYPPMSTFLESKGRDVQHYPVPQYYVGESIAWLNGYKDVAKLTAEQINAKVTELNAG